MAEISSGTYVIDSNYNIVGFNSVAKDMYPTLEKGVKCHKALMNLDAPCEMCPVLNQIHGPKTYLDPIRRIYETVDAVEMPMEDGSVGHALIFSTVGESENLSNNLPTHEDGLRMLGIINALSSDISDLYSVDVESHLIEIYRFSGNARGVQESMAQAPVYEDAMKAYIKLNVHPDDAELMTEMTDFSYIKKRVETDGNFTFHYRTNRDGQVHYYYMKCSRNGELGAYDSISFAFACEDNQVNRKKMLEALERDALTGLYTKHAFVRYAQQLLDQYPEEEFDIAIADVENFRLLNNIYGEEKGNELLASLGKFFVNADSRVLWGRFSGDQFVAMGRSRNSKTTEDLETLMRGFADISPIPNVVIKWGTYRNVDRNLTVTYMCDRAAVALESIKHNYSQSTATFDGPVSRRHYNAQLYETKFQNAIDNKEFVVWYQPKYDPYNNQIVGAEALVRWIQDGNVLPPGDFLGVFEEDGLIRQLDEYVFEQVCEFQRMRKRKSARLIPISVNLSRNSMRHADAVDRYAAIAEECGIEPQYLPIEITESADIESKDIKALVEAFVAAGFPLHMDDFGSGRSSLHSLNALDFDVIKIDKGLVDYIGDENGDIILHHTIVMANDLKLRIVAEGVENKQQLDFLMDKGCDMIQGYYFSKPLSEGEFERQLEEEL